MQDNFAADFFQQYTQFWLSWHYEHCWTSRWRRLNGIYNILDIYLVIHHWQRSRVTVSILSPNFICSPQHKRRIISLALPIRTMMKTRISIQTSRLPRLSKLFHPLTQWFASSIRSIPKSTTCSQYKNIGGQRYHRFPNQRCWRVGAWGRSTYRRNGSHL